MRHLLSILLLACPLFSAANPPEMLINAQGLAQRDLSIRGSSYTGAGLSVNGIPLKVPYTAHDNAALPLCAPLLSDAQIHFGLDTVSGHPVGTSTRRLQPLDPQTRIRLGLGTDERYRTFILSSSEHVGGYFDWEKARSIDHDANDLERFTGGAFTRFELGDWRIDLLGAGESREYGAQGYYGIPATVHAEEQTGDALLLASAIKGDLDGSFMRAGASFREFDQEYRIPSTNYMSDVRSRYGSLMAEGRTLEVQNIALNLRGDLEHERVGGDIGTHHRTRGSILLLPEARFERITLTAGLNSVFQTGEAAAWLPQAGLDFFATDNLRLYGSYSETVQQPDYQTLYVADPYHAGNAGLDPQRVRNTELGLHQFLSAELDWRAAAFYRRQDHATDWTRNTKAEMAWTATDLGALDVYGVDAAANYRAADTLRLQLYYQWIAKDDYEVYSGLYELDYPEHLLAISGFWQLLPEIQIFGAQVLRCQTDNNVRSSNDFGAEASLGLHYDPRFAQNVRLSFLVENLWDSDFQPIPGLKPRPRTFSTGITVSW